MAETITGILQAADKRIDGARDRIVAVSSALSDHFNAGMDDFVPGTIDAQIGRLDDGENSLSVAMTADVATALTGATALFTARYDATSLALADWQQIVAGCEGEYQAFAAATDTIRANIGTAVTMLNDTVSAITQSIDGVFDALDQTSTNWNQRLGSELLGDLEAQWQDVANAIAQTYTPDAQNLLTASHGDMDQTLTDLFATAASSLQKLATDVGGAFDNLDDHLTSHARQKVQDAVANLVQDGIEEVLKTIIHAIAKAQIGTTITAAMAEILPILIPIKKGAEAMLAAIRLFKQPLGMF